MPRITPFLVLLTVLCPVPAHAQVVRGRVVDANTRDPLPTAVVRLLAGDSVVAQGVVDDSGRFALAAPSPGDYRLAAERIGYTTAVVGPLRIGTAVTDVQLRLDPRAVVLDALIVATEAQIAALDRVGYYRRQREGLGKYVDRQAIENRNAIRTTDVFRGVPGVIVVPTPNGGEAVLLRGGMGSSSVNPRCPPTVWIDGIVAFGDGTGFDWRTLHPSDIEAVEIYRSPAEVPAQYGGATAACGVVMVWMRRGGV